MGRQSRTKRERRQYRRATAIPEPIAPTPVTPEPGRPTERAPTAVTADEIQADIRRMLGALASLPSRQRRRTVASAQLIPRIAAADPRLALQALADAPDEER